MIFSLASAQLRKEGYTNIDAMDGSESMLELAKKKELYTNIYCCMVDTSKVDVIDDGNQNIYSMLYKG